MSKENTLLVLCPACHAQRHISRKGWEETFRKDKVWDGRRRRLVENPGPESPIDCHSCKQSLPASDWHRAYEQRVFAEQGWWTTRMKLMEDVNG